MFIQGLAYRINLLDDFELVNTGHYVVDNRHAANSLYFGFFFYLTFFFTAHNLAMPLSRHFLSSGSGFHLIKLFLL